MTNPTSHRAQNWDGVERRLAGNYRGRIALVLPGQAVPPHHTVVLQVWRNRARESPNKAKPD